MSQQARPSSPKSAQPKEAAPNAPATSESNEGKKEHELFEQRLASANKWRELGANPFGNGFRPQHLAGRLLEEHHDRGLDAAQKALDHASKAKDTAGVTAAKAILTPS